MSDNKINDGQGNFIGLENLKQLLLSGNKIKQIDQLIFLVEFENLHILELLMCAINNIEGYCEDVFNFFTKINVSRWRNQ